jgi:hypothetical protein
LPALPALPAFPPLPLELLLPPRPAAPLDGTPAAVPAALELPAAPPLGMPAAPEGGCPPLPVGASAATSHANTSKTVAISQRGSGPVNRETTADMWA